MGKVRGEREKTASGSSYPRRDRSHGDSARCGSDGRHPAGRSVATEEDDEDAFLKNPLGTFSVSCFRDNRVLAILIETFKHFY